MIYVGCDLKDWSDKHKIQIIECTCSNCGLIQETTVPVMTYKSYGLVTPKHKCSNPQECYTFVPREKYQKLIMNVLGMGLQKKDE